MKQIYHSNATTNVLLRTEISNSNATNLELSEKYNISINTVIKWKNRNDFEIRPSPFGDSLGGVAKKLEKPLPYVKQQVLMLLLLKLLVLDNWKLRFILR